MNAFQGQLIENVTHLFNFITFAKISRTFRRMLVLPSGLKYLCSKVYKFVSHWCSVGTMSCERNDRSRRMEVSGRSTQHSSMTSKNFFVEPL